MPRWVWPSIAGVLVATLVALSVVTIGQSRQLQRAQRATAALEAEAASLRAEVARLEARLRAEGGGAPDEPALGDLLDGLLGGDLDALDDLLGGDLGGLGELRGLLDGLLGGSRDPSATVPGAACLTDTSASGPLGLLDGLLGGPAGTGASPEAVIDRIAAEVAAVRGHDWVRDVEVTLLDDAAIRTRLRELVAADLDPTLLDAEARLLAALGVLAPGIDLAELQLGLLEDQVAGFYVPESGELVVRTPDDGRLGPLEQVVLAHELGHALTDQVLGLPDTSALVAAGDADAALAALALIEGDASLVMQRWASTHLSLTDRLTLALDPTIAAGSDLEGIPYLVEQQLVLPYLDGLDWACELVQTGGWEAVDEAYTEPPTTSAAVLFGRAGAATTTVALGTPPGFVPAHTTTFGAAQLLWLLEAPGDDPSRAVPDAERRARTWGGGTATVATDGTRSAVGLAFVDDGTGSTRLCATIDAWYAVAFPDATRTTTGGGALFAGAGPAGEDTAVLRCTGRDVVLGIGPDTAAARAIARG